jgi:bacterioferritin
MMKFAATPPFNKEYLTMPVQTQKEPVKTEVAKSDKRIATTMNRDRQALIDGLNLDLGREYQAMVMYIHFSAKLTGPCRRELRAFFQEEISDEQRHAQFLADKITALGGEPTTKPAPAPHADQPREMLEQALAVEMQAITDYGARIRQAEAFGDIGLKVSLENHIADETRHKEEIERILADWNEPNLEGSRNEGRWQDDGGQG